MCHYYILFSLLLGLSACSIAPSSTYPQPLLSTQSLATMIVQGTLADYISQYLHAMDNSDLPCQVTSSLLNYVVNDLKEIRNEGISPKAQFSETMSYLKKIEATQPIDYQQYKLEQNYIEITTFSKTIAEIKLKLASIQKQEQMLRKQASMIKSQIQTIRSEQLAPLMAALGMDADSESLKMEVEMVQGQIQKLNEKWEQTINNAGMLTGQKYEANRSLGLGLAHSPNQRIKQSLIKIKQSLPSQEQMLRMLIENGIQKVDQMTAFNEDRSVMGVLDEQIEKVNSVLVTQSQLCY